MKRVLLDVNSVVPFYVDGTVKGIGRTTRELVMALDALEELPVEVVLYSQNMKGIGASNLETHFRTRHLYMPYREKWNHWVSALSLRELLTRYDLMHIPHNHIETRHADRCLVTMHDAMFFSFPEEAFNPEFCRIHYTEFAQRCRAVITCSEASKTDIVNYMHIPPERVHVIPWGFDSTLFRPQELPAPECPFFLSASCSTGRKNTLNLLRAFHIYVQRGGGHNLCLVWRHPAPEAEHLVAELKLEERVLFAKDVSDLRLSELYSQATATFFPSRYEGFGLPLLESMACGTPVVTCRNSSLPEVGGDAARYTDPDSPEAMAHEMSLLEQMSREDYTLLSQQSLAQAHRFSWEKCARETVKVYLQYI